MDLTEKQISFEYKFQGRIINLRVDDALLPNGTTAKREIVEHNGGVCVAPLDNDYNLYFVKQFRYPYMEIVTELPAGKLEKGEDPFEAGKRELKEETGATAKKYMDLGKLYPTPGYCGEIIHMYLATELEFGARSPLRPRPPRPRLPRLPQSPRSTPLPRKALWSRRSRSSSRA